jgi:hypothetical protein
MKRGCFQLSYVPLRTRWFRGDLSKYTTPMGSRLIHTFPAEAAGRRDQKTIHSTGASGPRRSALMRSSSPIPSHVWRCSLSLTAMNRLQNEPSCGLRTAKSASQCCVRPVVGISPQGASGRTDARLRDDEQKSDSRPARLLNRSASREGHGVKWLGCAAQGREEREIAL